MVKNSHNNKVNNYINIVNDLKGLGLLQRKRRRASTSATGLTQSKQQAKPQISGIEKTIIDNSPQLRRDVQQLANERSILEDRIMDNENRLNFLHRTINENPFRFMQKPSEPQRNLSDVQGDSLKLPTMSQLYKDDIELRFDGIDAPIVDASMNFIPRITPKPDDRQPALEPLELEPPDIIKSNKVRPVKESPDDIPPNRPVDVSSTYLASPLPSAEDMLYMASNDDQELSAQKPKQLDFPPTTQEKRGARLGELKTLRNTSPKPTPRKEIPLEYLASPNTIKKRETWLKEAPPDDIQYAKSLFGEELNLKPPVVRNIIDAQKSLEKEKLEAQTKGEEEKVEEPEVKKLSSAQRKAILAKERKQQDAELAELKANENASLAQVSKERALADAKTNNLIEANFSKYGGRDYVLANVKKDLDKIEKLATDDSTFVLNKNNQELMEKYYGYLKLSGSIQKFAGRGYGSTTLLFNIPRIKENLSKTLHMPDLWKARKPVENRSSSVPIQRSTGIYTLKDITENASIGGNTKA